MATPSSSVHPLRAGQNYLTSMQNLLLTAGTACFLGKHLVSFLGKDIANFPFLEKISNHTRDYFCFYDFASAASGLYSSYSILADGVSVLRGIETHNAVRDRRRGDFPREDNQYVGPKAWMAYKTASAIFRVASSLLLIHHTFNHIGVLNKSYSPTVRAIGGGLGAAGFIIEILDTQRAIYAHRQDANDGAVPTDAKIKSTNLHGGPRKLNGGDEALHQGMLQGARVADQIFMGLIVGIKVMGVIRALDMVDSPSLFGRASRFAVDNSENIYGGIFTAMSVTGIARHIWYGATIMQLENRNINKG